jgi:WD40 repeat protein
MIKLQRFSLLTLLILVLLSGCIIALRARWIEAHARTPLQMNADHNSYWDIIVSPCGQYAAGGTSNAELVIWNINSGAIEREILAHTSGLSIRKVEYSRDGKYIATIADEPISKVHEAATGRQVAAFNHANEPYAIALSPDNRHVLTRGGNGFDNLELWSVPTGKLVRTFWPVGAFKQVFSPDGRFLALPSNTSQEGIEIHDLDVPGNKPRILQPGKEVGGLAVAPDGKTIAAVTSEQLVLLDVATDAVVATFEGPFKNSFLRGPVFSEDSKKILAVTDSDVRVFDTSTYSHTLLHGATTDLYCYNFSPDSRRVSLIGREGYEASIWDSETGERLFVAPGFASISCLRHSEKVIFNSSTSATPAYIGPYRSEVPLSIVAMFPEFWVGVVVLCLLAYYQVASRYKIPVNA